ncbi:MAG: hypothetical protein LBE82_13365 [Chitinophagaceae bacterium]|jgi:hypothetical protein|nr:hypothetical protein [Chitinophagaceae bacterium]
MKKLILITFASLIILNHSFSQVISKSKHKTFIDSSYQVDQHINYDLKKELDSISIADQKYREITFSSLQTKADSFAAVFKVPENELADYLIKTMQQTDSSNIKRVKEICSQYGYPGKSLVGTPTNEAAFYVIQHSLNIDEYLPLIKKAADNGELSFRLYAMMLDRSLMYHGQEQMYGTQVKGFYTTNSQSGKREFVRIVWPIKNPAQVNERRKQAGFDRTVEENANRLGTEYKVLTLEDVKKMQEK